VTLKLRQTTGENQNLKHQASSTKQAPMIKGNKAMSLGH
jgi:hypothetical protein